MLEPDSVLKALRARLDQCLITEARWAPARLDQAEQRLAAGLPIERAVTELTSRIDTSTAAVTRRAAQPLSLNYPETLPVSGAREQIIELAQRERVFVLTGETGSGKTTQLPKMLLEAGYGRRGMIALTQPRRVAAVAMAARIREELQAPTGAVAHSVRFDDRSTPDTLIRVMTDGLLLAEINSDPDLLRYDAIIVDEAHERSLNIDLLLGLLKLLRVRRPDLAVVVASASIEAERFANFFGRESTEVSSDPATERAVIPASIVAVTGRMFPVDIVYQPPSDDDISYLTAAVNTVRDLIENAGSDSPHGQRGDILVFLPTERDILDARKRLDELPGTTVLPLFGRLTPSEQQRVFAPARGRKVVLATNLAETSLTIPGIRYVIDTGLARYKRYQASSRTERLPVEPISQASALQRAGRAGRIEAGVCIRLYPEEDFTRREAFTAPEILRSNLAGVVLTCLGMGLGQPEQFPWLDAPSPHAWQLARGLLEELGAFTARSTDGEDVHVHRHQSLSPMGRSLAAIPADPQVARILIAGLTEGVPHEACTLAAFLSVQDPRVRPIGQEAKADSAQRAFAHEAGDLATVLRLWARYQAAASNSARARLCEQQFLGYRRMREWADVRHQLWNALRESRAARQIGNNGLPPTGHEDDHWPLDAVHRAVLAGMLGNVLMHDREARCYIGAGERQLAVHPGSALRSGKTDDGKRAPPPAPWLVCCEVVETSRLFARLCAPIDPEWVVQLAGERVKRRHRDPRYDPRRRQVVCLETITWKGLPIRDGRLVPYERVSARDATAIFVRECLCAPPDDEAHAPDGRQRAPTGLPAVIGLNHRVLSAAHDLRHRLRDNQLTIDEALLEGFYRERLGLDALDAPTIASTDAFRRWLNERGPEVLTLTAAALVPAAAVMRAEGDFPLLATWPNGSASLTYRFAPGDADDGATLTLTDAQALRIAPAAVDWFVPGWIEPSIHAYLESAPKDLRRLCIPLAETARALAEECRADARRLSLHEALAQRLRARFQLTAVFDPAVLPAHLRLRFRVTAVDGSVLYTGRDRGLVFRQGLGRGDRLAPLRARWDTAPAAHWPGDCPGAISDGGLTGQVALARARDERGNVAARRALYASASAAAAWHQDGLDALLEASCAAELAAVVAAPAPAHRVATWEKALGARHGALRRQLALTVLLGGARRGQVAKEADFTALRTQALTQLTAAAQMFDVLLSDLAGIADTVRERIKQGARSLAAAGAQRAAADDLARLLGPGWPTRLPWATTQRLPLFVRAIITHLDHALREPAQAQRLAARVAVLDDLADASLGGDTPRWLAALGRTRQMREILGQIEECRFAVMQPGTASGSGFAEGQVRQQIAELDAAVVLAKRTIADARATLLEARPLLDRLPAGASRDALKKEVDERLASLPDLSLGADLDAQADAARAQAARVKAALTRE